MQRVAQAGLLLWEMGFSDLRLQEYVPSVVVQ